MRKGNILKNRGFILLVLSVFIFVSVGCAHVTNRTDISLQKPGKPICTGFINKTLDNGKLMKRYVVYVPYEYTPQEEIPMIIFLHGAGERGQNGLLQTEVGLGTAIRRHPERWKAIVVFPQCPASRFYNEIEEDIDLCIEKTLKEYNIDKKRIYLTGLSMGGFGTWIYGAKHADLFAGLVPICGGGELAFIKQRLGRPEIPDETPQEVEQRVQRLRNMPIWAFHGADDDVVPADCSRSFVQKIKDAGGIRIRYTEYPGVKHNSWIKAYDDPELSKWLFSQSK